jgi:hypothetical protein
VAWRTLWLDGSGGAGASRARRDGSVALAGHAQKPERKRRVGVLVPWPKNDAEANVSAFARALSGLG